MDTVNGKWLSIEIEKFLCTIYTTVRSWENTAHNVEEKDALKCSELDD